MSTLIRRRAGWLFGAVALMGVIAACGAGATPAAVSSTSAPGSVQSASAPPSGTPAPPPPIVVIEQAQGSGDVLQAIDASGAPLWAVPNVKGSIYTAGPRIFIDDFTTKRISVVDRSGHTIGSGDAGQASVFSPVSAEWAWSQEDSTSPSPNPQNGSPITATGSFWVAGIGEAAHRVYSWSQMGMAAGAGGPYNSLVEWSDQGLVSSPLPPGAGCAGYQQTVSYAVDPATGARTVLASDGRAVVDVHAGLVAAFPKSDPQTVLLSGRTTFNWTNTPAVTGEHPGNPVINPSGTSVMVPLSNTGCAGEPQVRTAFIDVATHAVTFASGVYCRFWVDDTHCVGWVPGPAANPVTPNEELDIVTTDGTRAALGHGNVVGVLPGS